MVLRRAKLAGHSAHQIAAAKAATADSVYASIRTKFVLDSDSGERK